MNKRYIVISENLHSGELREEARFIRIHAAEMLRQCWNFHNHIGWIKDTQTGEIF